MTSMPPGWYDDGRGALRWWDGAQWTEHVAVPDAEGAEPEEGGVEDLPPELAEFAEDAPDDAGSGAFGAATDGKRSKLWVVWAVLGVVLLGIVVAIAVIVPLLFLNHATRTPSVAPESADEQAAVAAVEQYNDAWLDGDCDDYTEATAPALRESQSITDCAAFEEASGFFADSVDNYSVTITAIERDGDAITVSTRDSYDSYLDDNGDFTEATTPFTDPFTHVLVASGDDWVIESIR